MVSIGSVWGVHAWAAEAGCAKRQLTQPRPAAPLSHPARAIVRVFLRPAPRLTSGGPQTLLSLHIRDGVSLQIEIGERCWRLDWLSHPLSHGCCCSARL